MKFDKFKIFLILILILAAFLRLWNLASFPDGLNADEASLGYNAYSILHTGRDEYGAFLPLSLKSFGDYKPDLYTYLDIPFVAVLNLNVLSTRLPGALFGILAVFLIYLLAKKIFDSEKVGILSAFLLAISPWHLQFSRGAWETNVATTFILLGVYLFILFLEKEKYLFWSLLCFLASMYTYQSPRLIVPIFGLFLILFFWKDHFKKSIGKILKKNLIFFIIILILSVPFARETLSGSGAARFQGLSIFSDPGPMLRANQLRGEDGLNSFSSRIFYNTPITYGISFVSHYLDHFSFNFWFINGDSLIRNNVPEVGEFFIIEALFLIVGLLCLINVNAKYKKILIIWILVSPLASSLTYQTPSALRSLNMVIPLTIIMGLGLSKITELKLYVALKYLMFGLVGLVLLFEFWHYLESYYIVYPKAQPLSWEYGFEEMVPKLLAYQGNFKKVVITDRYDQPYILVLYFEKYPPNKYQPQAKLSPRDKFNFGTVRSFDKYEFHSITKQEVDSAKDTLFIGTPLELSGENSFDAINFPNGEKVFVFVAR